MESTDELAPAVRDVLTAARRRDPPDGRVEVDARSLPAALAAASARDRTPVVAEVKPTSPTTHGTRDDDPAELARRMVDGGASAVSVLTEPEHFGGSAAGLRRVRRAVDVPVLRKDFVLSPAELDRVAADAVLLIARFLDDLAGMVSAARERGMQPLVEVHDRDGLAAATDADADLIGVNNRDLAGLTVDLGTVERVAPAAPTGVTVVAESGISSPADARRMREAGVDGLLVGSAIMAGDVYSNTRELVAA